MTEEKTINELIEFGVINLDKPSGPTSFQTAERVKRIFGLKKMGHFGTLDPKVTGVLPIALNRACKIQNFFMRKDKDLTIELRLQGLTYSQISERLGISKSTLSYWLKNIKLDKKATSKISKHIHSTKIVKLIERNKKKTEIARKKNEAIRKVAKKEAKKFIKDPLFITGLALYWGEGYKKGADGSKWKSIDFANSDAVMIKVIMKFFYKYLLIKKTDIKIQIMLHNPDDNEKSVKFWKDITELKEENFIKTSYVISKSSKKKMTTHLPYGTVHIRINNVNLFFRLIGWIDFLKETM